MSNKKSKKDDNGKPSKPLSIPSFIPASLSKAIVHHAAKEEKKPTANKKPKTRRSRTAPSPPPQPLKSPPQPVAVDPEVEEDESEMRIDDFFSQEFKEVKETRTTRKSAAPGNVAIPRKVSRDPGFQDPTNIPKIPREKLVEDEEEEEPVIDEVASPLKKRPKTRIDPKTGKLIQIIPNTILSQINRWTVNLTVFVNHIWTEPLEDSDLPSYRILIRDFDGIFSVLLLDSAQFTDDFKPGNSIEFSNLVPCEKFVPKRKLPFFSIIHAYGSTQNFYYILRFDDDTSWKMIPSKSSSPLLPLIFMLKGAWDLTNKARESSKSLKDIVKAVEKECRVWATGRIKVINEEVLTLSIDAEDGIPVKILPNFDIEEPSRRGIDFEAEQVTLTMLRIVEGEIMLDEYSTIEKVPLTSQQKHAQFSSESPSLLHDNPTINTTTITNKGEPLVEVEPSGGQCQPVSSQKAPESQH